MLGDGARNTEIVQPSEERESRREGGSWGKFAWRSVDEKGDILSNVPGIIWFYADILPRSAARRALRSVICTAGKRSHTKCFYIFFSSPLPLPDRPKPRNLSAPANLHARPFSGRASLANLAIDDPAFFEGWNEKKKKEKYPIAMRARTIGFSRSL